MRGKHVRRKQRRKQKPLAAKLIKEIRLFRKTLKPRKLVRVALSSKANVYPVYGVDMITYSRRGTAQALIRMTKKPPEPIYMSFVPLKKNPNKVTLLQISFRHGANVFYYKNNPEFVCIYANNGVATVYRDHVPRVIEALKKYIEGERDGGAA
jgi:hypothetical protein